jgi:PAS domain S-box-containing protein
VQQGVRWAVRVVRCAAFHVSVAQMFRSLLRACPLPAAILDAEGRVLDTNSACEQLTGASASSLAGRPLWDVLDVTDEQRARLAAAVSTRSTTLLPVVDTDRSRHLTVAISPIETSAGGATLLACIAPALAMPAGEIAVLRAAYDRAEFLSEVSRSLASCTSYRESLRLLADLSVPRIADWCAIDILHQDERLERIAVAHTDPAKVAFGFELDKRWPTTLRSTSGVASVLRTGRATLVPFVSDEVLAAASLSPEHHEMQRRLGLRAAIVIPLRARGRVLGAISFFMAESGRTYGDDDLRFVETLAQRAALVLDNARLLEEAQSANRAKDDLLANLSHELRTPLQAILGWTAILRSDSGSERLARGLDVIERNARLQSRVIEDLLDMSRAMAGILTVQIQLVDLPAVVRSGAESLEAAAGERDIALSTDLQPGIEIEGDEVRLQQVVWNLLSNAVKFTEPGGRIHVRLRADGERAEIVVRDTGIGIPPDLLRTIFDRFRQGDPAAGQSRAGLGLGLAIVRHIVDAHGGDVEASSEGVRRGASFTVRLPIRRRPVPADDPSDAPPLPDLSPM